MSLDSEIVREIIAEIAGKDVIELVELIKGKEHVSEFKIAEKLNITVNQIRNMLYRLYSYNLVTFIRKKDKRKGWYIYYWTFDERKAYDLFVKIKKEKLRILQERLESEKNGTYFICPNECIRLNLEIAMEHDFKCPDCGQILKQEDNEKRIKYIEKEINEINEKLTKPYVETPKRKPREKKVAKKKITKKGKKTTVKKKAVKRKKPPQKKKKAKKTISKIKRKNKIKTHKKKTKSTR